MTGIFAVLAVAAVLAMAALVGRKSEPYELRQDAAPEIKPFIPSEEVGIFGTRRVVVEDILAGGGTGVSLDQMQNSPRVEQALEEGAELVLKGHPDRAAEILADALILDPDNPDLLLALGDTYQIMGLFQESLEYFVRADAVVPGDVSVLLRLGQLLERLEERERTLAVYQQILAINPDDAEAADAVGRLAAGN